MCSVVITDNLELVAVHNLGTFERVLVLDLAVTLNCRLKLRVVLPRGALWGRGRQLEPTYRLVLAFLQATQMGKWIDQTLNLH